MSPEDRYSTALEFHAELHAWADDYPVERLSERYKRRDRFRLLLKRCREHNQVDDHSQLVAYGGIAMAIASFTFPLVGYCLILRGMDVEAAGDVVGWPYDCWLIFVSAVVGWLTVDRTSSRPRLASTAMQLFVTLGIRHGFAFECFLLVLSEGEPTKFGGFQFVMTAATTVYVGMWKPEWSGFGNGLDGDSCY